MTPATSASSSRASHDHGPNRVAVRSGAGNRVRVHQKGSSTESVFGMSHSGTLLRPAVRGRGGTPTSTTRSPLTEVAGVLDQREARVEERRGADDVGRAVAAAVVDDEDFVIPGDGRQRRGGLADGVADGVLLVPGGEDKGETIPAGFRARV